MSTLSRKEAIEKYGKEDRMKHVTRYSDSSLYDEKCVLCGLTDTYMGGKTISNTPCIVENDSYAYSDPVRFIKEIGLWGFWDEAWSDFHGNWKTEEEARENLSLYVKQNLL